MINLAHSGYELHYSLNLTNPTVYDSLHHKDLINQIKWFLLRIPRISGRVYRKDYPQEDFWSDNDVYMTYYKGRGRINKGDRMVCFYMEEPEIDIRNVDFGDNDEEALF